MTIQLIEWLGGAQVTAGLVDPLEKADRSRQHLPGQGGGPISETSVGNHLHAALGAAGLPHHVFHDFRHTFGTAMAAGGVPLRTLQACMGHEKIDTTMIYAHYAPTARESVHA